MLDRILRALADIECEEAVRIFYACESGSRAWGFASPESDYDPRFFYAHPPDWYLFADPAHRRDVIERPIAEKLDLSGWDLQKALRLLLRSNPPLLEWLYSPIVYLDRYGAADRMREIVPEYFSPDACKYHYLHMARGNVRKYLSGETIDRKNYFYALRPLLAVRWLDEGRGIAPMEFPVLLDAVVRDRELRETVGDVLRRKRTGEDMTNKPHIPEIRNFIEREMERLADWEMGADQVERDAGRLNETFRDILRDVTGRACPCGDFSPALRCSEYTRLPRGIGGR